MGREKKGAGDVKYVLENLLLEGAARDDAVHVYDLLLADAMGAVHGLDVLLRVPVVLDEDDGVGARQVEA